MVSYAKLTRPMYVGYSSGYFIIKTNSTCLLINPFTRIKKVINSSSLFGFDYTIDQFHGLLAFQKCSEEFVLLVLCKKYGSLYAYQSRNNSWVTYFRKGKREMIHDIMVLNNIIYAVTNKGRIGVVSLNSAIIKFRKLKNTPNIVTFSNLYLVNYDEQLLVVGLNPVRFGRLDRAVYKIDWLTMRYVALKSLGDIALFHVKGKCCKSLSNPNRWGYESNSVYEVDFHFNKYSVYNWDKEWDQKYMEFPRTRRDSLQSWLSEYDWCCNQKYEVDYSLVE
ncbi:uncharacterized protein LOC131604397 [Vicia villosa]|uniref:uncharacterized protein LOC131604397 n=1 Tax=Vicia villosa TaxID=3911 RepID=UPI00273C7FB2|nr:uncharacterized protein LOC131604397 [Vicia villosa]